MPAVRAFVCAIALAAVGFLSTSAQAGDPTAGSKATNSRAVARRCRAVDSLRSTPGRDASSRVAAVVNNPSIFRRLPIATIDCDPDLYLLLLRNPEIVIDIWQIMGITNMALTRTGPNQFHAADGQGTVGTLEFAYRSADMHVIYSTGSYDGSLSPAKIRGESVVVLKTEYLRNASGQTRIVSRLDVFLHLDNVGIEWIAKTLQPLLGKTADHNFAETASFVASLSHTAENNPAGVGRLANRLPHVDAPTRQRLSELSEQASDRADAVRAAMSQPSAKSRRHAGDSSSGAGSPRRSGFLRTAVTPNACGVGDFAPFVGVDAGTAKPAASRIERRISSGYNATDARSAKMAESAFPRCPPDDSPLPALPFLLPNPS